VVLPRKRLRDLVRLLHCDLERFLELFRGRGSRGDGAGQRILKAVEDLVGDVEDAAQFGLDGLTPGNARALGSRFQPPHCRRSAKAAELPPPETFGLVDVLDLIQQVDQRGLKGTELHLELGPRQPMPAQLSVHLIRRREMIWSHKLPEGLRRAAGHSVRRPLELVDDELEAAVNLGVPHPVQALVSIAEQPRLLGKETVDQVA
jgi:hypothetical protein